MASTPICDATSQASGPQPSRDSQPRVNHQVGSQQPAQVIQTSSDTVKWGGLQSQGKEIRGKAMDTLGQVLLSYIQTPVSSHQTPQKAGAPPDAGAPTQALSERSGSGRLLANATCCPGKSSDRQRCLLVCKASLETTYLKQPWILLFTAHPYKSFQAYWETTAKSLQG